MLKFFIRRRRYLISDLPFTTRCRGGKCLDSRPWLDWSANLLVPLSKFIMTTATVDRFNAFYLALRLDLFTRAALLSLLEQRLTSHSIFFTLVLLRSVYF